MERKNPSNLLFFSAKLSVGGLPKIDPKGKLLTKMCSTDQENDGQTIADAKTNKFIGLARQVT